jgi:hypothetical protein
MICRLVLYYLITCSLFLYLFFSHLEGKPKCQTGGKSKRTIQGAHKTSKQVHLQHFPTFLFNFNS